MTQSDIINNNFSKAFECIKCSNAYDTGEVLSEEKLFKQISERKHSTFDLSKFEVVGSPTITDNGIASGFSNSNYLQTNNISITNANWEVTIPLDTTNLENGNIGVFSIPSVGFIYVDVNKSNKTSPIFIVQEWVGAGTVSQNISIGKKYIIKWGMKNGKHYSKIKADDSQEWSVVEKDYTVVNTTNSQFYIGRDGHNGLPCTNGSIDLKQFSITVDGKEVFNGNKTGLDVIKEDNYTVVGTPTITDDGIFSWNSKNDSVTYFSNNSLNTTNYEIRTRVIISNKTSLRVEGTGYTQFLHCYSRGTDAIQLYTDGTNKINIYGSGFSYTNLVSNALNYNIIDIIIKNDGNLFTATAIDGETGLVISKKTSATSGSELSLTTTNLKIAANPFFMSATATYKIDINYTKVYVDGNLVYQPCLKIPYTQSKTGSKIVDGIYRDRVIDLYEQEGQAKYYTIDEPNKNFTLPMGEIYGMIGGKSDKDMLNNPYSLFDSKYSDHELNNLSWLKSEGQWNAKAVYPTAYDKLLKVYNGTETIAGLSVKLSTETYTDYDFVLNTSDETFRLPLKNHTADDGKSVLTLYYYVGETVQNANLIDAGRINEQLSGLVEVGGSLGMPSNKYVDLALGNSGSEYTAPANGYFSWSGRLKGSVAFFQLHNKTTKLGTQAYSTYNAENGVLGYCFVPVSKGDVVVTDNYANTSLTTTSFRFIYAVGDV